jgi:hypothetical protein
MKQLSFTEEVDHLKARIGYYHPRVNSIAKIHPSKNSRSSAPSYEDTSMTSSSNTTKTSNTAKPMSI